MNINKNEDHTKIFPTLFVAGLTIEGATTYSGSRSIDLTLLMIKNKKSFKKIQRLISSRQINKKITVLMKLYIA